mmetsp:Transcript_38779/g.124300  ORF Transcript_38779/g.124300 Transcript_38779/m.124300 type:complete len:178 (+) Transcript_38779:2-535(+)
MMRFRTVRRLVASSCVRWRHSSSQRKVAGLLALARVDRPEGSLLLYWPGAWSIALAAAPGAPPDVALLTLFGVGAFVMRGAGCTINDMWDRDFDRRVERTRGRPIAAGDVPLWPDATLFLGAQLSAGLAVRVLRFARAVPSFLPFLSVGPHAAQHPVDRLRRRVAPAGRRLSVGEAV